MRPTRSLPAALAICLSTPLLYAQDSTAPNGSDALTVTAEQRVRYALDLAPITSSWGQSFAIGPVIKSLSDEDGGTWALGAYAISPTTSTDPTFASRQYALWNAPGQGINPAVNLSSKQNLSFTGFDRGFALAVSDLRPDGTGVLSAMIGANDAQPSRLLVDRVLAATGRVSQGTGSTLAVGGVDATGVLTLRADDFGADAAIALLGQNIVTVDPDSRSSAINTISELNSLNAAGDPAATTFTIDNGEVTLALPTLLATPTGPKALGLNLKGELTVDGAAPAGAPTADELLAPGTQGLRGNPAFVATSQLGGVGAVVSLAKSENSRSYADSLHAFGLDANGNPQQKLLATLPQPLTDGGFTANTNGDAAFRQYLSQAIFRGPSGHAAMGYAPQTGSILLAATATDPIVGDFIALAAFNGGAAQWSAPVHAGTAITNGITGSTIGAIVTSASASISAPAIDTRGNLYFVAEYAPTGDSPRTGVFKATPSAGGYALELLLTEGQSIVGENSQTPYTIDEITLADSDSVAAGAFHSAAILAEPLDAGAEASSPASFGGLAVNARITYQTVGTPQTYNALMMVSPVAGTTQACEGDATGDGNTDLQDLNTILSLFGQTTTGPADLDGSGTVDLQDLNLVLSNFGCVG